MFKLKIKLSWIIFAALAWAYLVQPTLWPFPAIAILRVPCLAAGALLLAYLYRTVEFDLALNQSDLVVLSAYIGLFGLLNIRVLSESLGGDELYHSERAVFFLHALKFIPEGCCGMAALRRMPITELNSLLSVSFLFLAGTGWFLWSGFKRRVVRLPIRYGIYFAVASMAGLAMASVKVPPESHPSLRLLPLFLSQALFGLQDVSFRLPGIFAIGLISFFTYKLVQWQQTGQGWFYPFVIGFSIYLIPSVFHVSAIVEPSVWGFAAAAGSICTMLWASSTNDEAYWVLSGVLIGLGCLMRQNAVILWPAFILICLMNRRFIRRWSLILLPILFIAPYGMTLRQIGHPMAQVQMFERPSDVKNEGDGQRALSPSPCQNVLNSLASGTGPQTLLKSSSVPWILFTLAGCGLLIFGYRGPLMAYYLTFFVGYALFFSIDPKLWGVGRYQAEFVAPCTALTILLVAILAKGRWRAWLGCVLVCLGLYSVFFNGTISQDIHYDFWSRKRLSTESTFPYKEAIGFVQRQQSDGRFVILGGVPTYGRMILWLRGFNQVETETYWANQKELNESLTPMTLTTFLDFAHRQDLNYFLVQCGDKRESQHRSDALHLLLEEVGRHSAETLGTPPEDYVLQQTFTGDTEGAIAVFGKSRRRFY